MKKSLKVSFSISIFIHLVALGLLSIPLAKHNGLAQTGNGDTDIEYIDVEVRAKRSIN